MNKNKKLKKKKKQLASNACESTSSSATDQTVYKDSAAQTGWSTQSVFIVYVHKNFITNTE